MGSQALVIRADANIAIGTGHVMRCLALAQAWQDAGGRVVFAKHLPPSTGVPRVLALAEGFLDAVSNEFSERDFTLYVEGFQQTTALQLGELWTSVAALKLVIGGDVAER